MLTTTANKDEPVNIQDEIQYALGKVDAALMLLLRARSLRDSHAEKLLNQAASILTEAGHSVRAATGGW